MKTLKFIPKNKGQFTATLRKNVNDYFKEKGISTKGNSKIIIKSIVMLTGYLAPFVVMLTLPLSGWLIFPLSIIMGIGMAGIGMNVMHDAVHGSFSKQSWLNKLFGHTMYFIGGNTFNWKVQHNVMHHTYTNIEGFDEDIEPKGSLRLSKQSPLKKVHRYQYIYAFFLYCFMTLFRNVGEFFQLAKYNKAGVTKQQGTSPRKEMARLIFFKVAYLAIIIGLPLVFSGFSWWLILTGFLVMHAIAGLFMSTVFQMAHMVETAEQPTPDTHGNIENEWTIHELETTVNFSRKSRIFSWMIGGLNYQIEHHLFPNICHIHYPAISPIVERTALEFGLNYHTNRTFFTALGSHVRFLKTLGRS
ncbi:MAG: acyl-CoA desaturase [Bacteroidetes bacterium]|jgi:linoleoyl-CoA desaturase|nr:acyl-CoA desaturase [Bacteroidota bacterium]MDF2451880.1 acyl-CoA desaturase [Bacteroidota bacterium]